MKIPQNIEYSYALSFPPFSENFHPKISKSSPKLTPSPPPTTTEVRGPPLFAAHQLRPFPKSSPLHRPTNRPPPNATHRRPLLFAAQELQPLTLVLRIDELVRERERD
jgi:hypothetical protein